MVANEPRLSGTNDGAVDDAPFANHPLFDVEFVAAVLGLDVSSPVAIAAEYRRSGAPALVPFHPLVDPGALPERLRQTLREGDVERVLAWLTTRPAAERRWSALWDPREIGAAAVAEGDGSADSDAGTGVADTAAKRRAQARARASLKRISALDPDQPLPGQRSELPWGQMRAAMMAVARERTAIRPGIAGAQPGRSVRTDGTVSIVIVDGRESPERVVRSVTSAAAHLAERRVEVIVALHPGRQLHGALQIAARTAMPAVVVVPAPADGRPNPLARALVRATGSIIILIDADVVLRDGAVDALVASLLDDRVMAAQPVIAAPDGAIIAAGLEPLPFVAGQSPFLEGLSADDVAFAATRTALALAPGALAARSADLEAALASDAALDERPIATALSAVLGARGRLEVLLDQWAVLTGEPAVRIDAACRPASRESAAIEQGRSARARAAWGEAGWTIRYLAPPPRSTARVTPILLRPDGHPLRDAARWSIKIGAAFSRSGDRWGDVPFAADLAAALRAEGCDVVVDRHHPGALRNSYLDDVVLALRGRHPIAPVSGRCNILWVISRPELIDLAEFEGFDVIAAASEPWARWASEQSGRRVEVLLQAAADRFRPASDEGATSERALFVGGARAPLGRQVVADAVVAGLPLELWGPQWVETGFGQWRAGDYLDNAVLPAAYAGAGVVLSDHFREMAHYGFINNRVFEAVAAGARVISDPVEGLEQLFGGAVRTYRTIDELAELFTDREAAFPTMSDRRAIAERIAHEHSFAARAAQLTALVASAGA